MAKPTKLRELTQIEVVEIRRLAASEDEPSKLVRRARLIAAMMDNPKLSAAKAAELAGYTKSSNMIGAMWVRRFNKAGISGLSHRSRKGRMIPGYSQEIRNALINMAKNPPSTMGYPIEKWTLADLHRALKPKDGDWPAQSTIHVWLVQEGFEWSRVNGWCYKDKK